MIRVSSISNLRKIEDYQHQFDEVWAIVRSLSRPIPGVKQVAVPSPSVDLFHKYLAKKKCKGMGAVNIIKCKKIKPSLAVLPLERVFFIMISPVP